MLRSTFSGFTTAFLGLQYNQKGLDVVGMNMTNVKTKGYTRQRLDNMSMNLNGLTNFYMTGANPNVGYGVEITGISQLRDKFLDIQYRDQQSKLSATKEVNHIEDLLSDVYDETNKSAIHDQLSNVSNALSNYSTHVGDNDQESIVKSEFQSLINMLYRDHVDTKKIKTDLQPSDDGQTSMSLDIRQVNDLIQNIAYVSKQISMSKALGNPALELLDKRNVMIDNLSKQLPISVKYTDKVTENNPKDRSADMDYITITLNDNDADPSNDIVLLKETQNGIKAQKNADGSIVLDPKGDQVLDENIYYRQLGAMVLGEGAVNDKGENIQGKTALYVTGAENDKPIFGQGIFTLQSKNVPEVFNPKLTANAQLYDISGVTHGYDSPHTITEGSLKGTLDMLNKAGDFDGTSVDGIDYYSDSLDLLVDKFAKTFNALNTPKPLPDGKKPEDYILFDAEFADGTVLSQDTKINSAVTYYKGDTIPKGAVLGADVTINGTLHHKGDTLSEDIVADGTVEIPEGTVLPKGYKLANAIRTAQGPFTAGNIRLSEAFRVGKVHLTASKDQDTGSKQNDNILAMIRAMTEKRAFQYKKLGNNQYESVEKGGVPIFQGNFSEYYTNISTTLGVNKKSTDMLSSTQKDVLKQISFNKDQISGVDMDEETISMLQYNQAYTAVSRLMTTLDQMLDTLMNTGRVGR